MVKNVMNAPLLMVLLLAATASYAQFKKAKYKSRFKKENFKSAPTAANPAKKSANSSASQPQKVNVTKGGQGNSQSAPNVFGRGTGIKNVNKTEKQQKYVNLNPETAFGPEVITSFDFPNTSLVDLTKHMQKLTGLNLILDKDIKGKISILAPTPITVGDAWKAYLTALNMNGYSMVKSGAFYKIVNSRDVRYTPTKIYTGSYSPDTESYIMRIIPLKNITASEITRSFRPFMSRYGRILDIKQTNTIIIHDTGSNINRLVRLIKFLDVPGHEESLQIIKVVYSSAQEIAKLLDSILKSGGSKSFKGSSSRATTATTGGNISKIIAEPRTNSIIAMANADGAKKLRSLIKKLDSKEVKSGGGKVHVYYLNYGNAEELAKTLNTLVSASTASSRTSSRTSRFSRSSASANTSLFANPVKLTADKENNALVVSASPTDYLTLKGVIDKLDIPRDQVYVEGIIMETAVNNGTDWGLSIVGGYGSGATQRAGYTLGSAALTNLTAGAFSSLGGLFVGGGSGPKVTLPGTTVEINSISGLINAIATNGQTNILATPQILALDNTEAVFEVGETVPISKTETGASNITTNSVDFQDVTLRLKIKPQINKVTRFIKLEIDQKVDDFSDRPPQGGVQSGVGTTTRSAQTTVVVRDRDTIAMGGLMRDKTTNKINKVPLLGDIPVLGWLFKRKEKTTEKVNMLFFLTPKILSSYQKTAAKNLKDVLNRRGAHLEKVLGDDDPHLSTVKGLYKKAKKQEQGPLYDKTDASFYRKANQAAAGSIPETPNYQEIARMAKAAKENQNIQAAKKAASGAAKKQEQEENTVLENIVK